MIGIQLYNITWWVSEELKKTIVHHYLYVRDSEKPRDTGVVNGGYKDKWLKDKPGRVSGAVSLQSEAKHEGKEKCTQQIWHIKCAPSFLTFM